VYIDILLSVYTYILSVYTDILLSSTTEHVFDWRCRQVKRTKRKYLQPGVNCSDWLRESGKSVAWECWKYWDTKRRVPTALSWGESKSLRSVLIIPSMLAWRWPRYAPALVFSYFHCYVWHCVYCFTYLNACRLN